MVSCHDDRGGVGDSIMTLKEPSLGAWDTGLFQLTLLAKPVAPQRGVCCLFVRLEWMAVHAAISISVI